MPLTRRQFLRNSSLATGTLLGANALTGVFARPAFADLLGPLDRYLLVVFLDGGNDGLNTIVPFDDVGGANFRSHYDTHRQTGGGGIRLTPGELAVPSSAFSDPGTGTQLGFHPALADLATLYDQNRLAVIQGCGYPEYSLSHDQSETIWSTANPLNDPSWTADGIVGRHLAAEYGGADIPAVVFSGGGAADFRQSVTNVLKLSTLRGFSFPRDEYDPGDDAAKDAVYQALHAQAYGGQPDLGFVGASGDATFESVQSYSTLHDDYRNDRPTFYDDYGAIGSFGRSFREVAKVIYGVEQAAPGVDARLFRIRRGGFDNHSNQGGATGTHAGRLSQLGQSLALFYADLEDMGAADKVVTVVWSEFSRRIPQNSNGTDHGSQGPMLVVGGNSSGTGPVTAGVYGNHPNIDPLALDHRSNTPYSQNPGDAHRSTDFRDVYGTIFKHWVTVPEATVLSQILPIDAGDPNEYWTTQDFDLGFL